MSKPRMIGFPQPWASMQHVTPGKSGISRQWAWELARDGRITPPPVWDMGKRKVALSASIAPVKRGRPKMAKNDKNQGENKS